MGERNSSVTRVRPVFRQLLARDPSGGSWLAKLLALANRNASYALSLAQQPGRLVPPMLERRCYKGRYMLEGCFERCLPPPEAFLRWLLDHPGGMRWPLDPRTGRPKEFSPKT